MTHMNLIPPGTRLKARSHRTREEGMCMMEAVAWFAGEEHSDAPACVGLVPRGIGISMNDTIPADQRRKRTDILVPAMPYVMGTWCEYLSPLDHAHQKLAGPWEVMPHYPLDPWLEAGVKLLKEIHELSMDSPIEDRYFGDIADPDCPPAPSAQVVLANGLTVGPEPVDYRTPEYLPLHLIEARAVTHPSDTPRLPSAPTSVPV